MEVSEPAHQKLLSPWQPDLLSGVEIGYSAGDFWSQKCRKSFLHTLAVSHDKWIRHASAKLQNMLGRCNTPAARGSHDRRRMMHSCGKLLFATHMQVS